MEAIRNPTSSMKLIVSREMCLAEDHISEPFAVPTGGAVAPHELAAAPTGHKSSCALLSASADNRGWGCTEKIPSAVVASSIWDPPQVGWAWNKEE